MEHHPDQHPPRPRLRLSIGVAGHRQIDDAAKPGVVERVRALLKEADEARRHLDAAGDTMLLSQLAAGADQIVAELAGTLGIGSAAILPFDRETFREDFAQEDAARFDALIERAAHVWTLPCARCDAQVAYALAGSLMLGQVDLLVAVWDGEHARGAGGTGDVVGEAIRRGIPVVHIPVADAPPTLLWSAIDGISAASLDHGSVPERAIAPGAVAQLVRRLLEPPAVAVERAALAAFLAERPRRWRLRAEYPLLLASAGIRKLGWSHLRNQPYAETTASEWAAFHARLKPRDAPDMAALERAFSWADRLADHHGQTYRSGVIFNYVAAALAVVVALAGVVAPAAKPWLMTLELLLIALLIVNTSVGNRRQWHRRWLDYRLLAEQLRPMRSLKLLGAGSPTEAWQARDGGDGRWTDWYAAAIWRQVGLPATISTLAEARRLAGHVRMEEIEPQIGYHRGNARRMHLLDHRLHLAGTALFWTTFTLSAIGVAGYLLGVPQVMAMAKWLTVLGAAFPTLGAALFGIRGQSDFAGAARRSAATASRLARPAERLTADAVTLAVAARAMEDAAKTMSSDLDQWRMSYLDRKLAIPA